MRRHVSRGFERKKPSYFLMWHGMAHKFVGPRVIAASLVFTLSRERLTEEKSYSAVLTELA